MTDKDDARQTESTDVPALDLRTPTQASTLFAENAAEWQELEDGLRLVRCGACLNLAVIAIIGLVALDHLLTVNPAVAIAESPELYQVVSWVMLGLGALGWFLTLLGINQCQEAPLPSPARYFAFAQGLFWFAMVVASLPGLASVPRSRCGQSSSSSQRSSCVLPGR